MKKITDGDDVMAHSFQLRVQFVLHNYTTLEFYSRQVKAQEMCLALVHSFIIIITPIQQYAQSFTGTKGLYCVTRLAILLKPQKMAEKAFRSHRHFQQTLGMSRAIP